jgi:hypothetical protein
MSTGNCLRKLRRWEEAERVLLECRAGFEATVGPDDSRTRDALALFKRVYEGWGHTEQANEVAARLARASPASQR